MSQTTRIENNAGRFVLDNILFCRTRLSISLRFVMLFMGADIEVAYTDSGGHRLIDSATKDRFKAVDDIFASFSKEGGPLDERWLFEQTILTSQVRRTVLDSLPIEPGSRVLDLGAGYGAVTFDLAAARTLRIDAVDIDAATLSVARRLHDRMLETYALADSTVDFSVGDVYRLPYPDATFDFAIGRFLFQHLSSPLSALTEIRRVLRPEGRVCLIDIDDQWNITYPEDSEAMRRLQEALCNLQERQGGDRHVGRKLAGYMAEAGLSVAGTAIYPQTQYEAAGTGRLELDWMLERFRRIRANLLDAGLITGEEFERHLETIRTEPDCARFHATAQFIVVGRR